MGGRPVGGEMARHQVLGGDRHRIDDQGQEEPHLDRHLVGSHFGITHASRDRHRHRERGHESRGPHEQRRPGADQFPQVIPPGPGPAQDQPGVSRQEVVEECSPAQGLRDHRGETGAGQSPSHSEDEHGIENQVDEAEAEADEHGGPGVAHPAVHRVPDGDHQDRGQAEAADPQVGDGVGRDIRPGAHQADQLRRGAFDQDQAACPQHGRHEQGLSGQLSCPVAVADSDRPGYERCSGVGQGDEDEERQAEDAGHHPHRCERVLAEASYEGGVDQRHQRLGGQRAQGRNGQAGDGAVVIGDPEHVELELMACDRRRRSPAGWIPSYRSYLG